MAAATGSKEKFNAREVLVSADAMRMQNLLWRDLMDDLAAAGAGADQIPFSGLVVAPTLTGIASSFNMALSAGRGYYYDPAFPGLTADDSFQQILRWPAQNITTFGAPDGSNPRIDTVVVAPAMVDADSFSRNILVDPTARTITPQNVFKTSNPVSTISVLTGTAASVPIPAPIPAGVAPLFEVYIPAAAADSTSFKVIRRLRRKTAYPASIRNGILEGCSLSWTTPGVDPTTTNTPIGLLGDVHRIAIDGEVIEWTGLSPSVSSDTLANPFATAAPAGNARPYYIYACGGRNLPQGKFSAIDSRFYPIVLVESTTPPDLDGGQPLVAIATPRGNTQRGALYIGLGFVYRNTTNRQPCFMTQRMTYGKNQFEAQTSVGSPVSFASAPSVNGRCRAVALVVDGVASTAGADTAIEINPVDFGAPAGAPLALIEASPASTSKALGATVEVPDASNGIAITLINVAVLNVSVTGYEHQVKRL